MPFASAPRVGALQPTAVNAILSEIREAESQGRKLLSLMRGEPDLATPPHIVEACTRALAAGRTTYPDNLGDKNFREAVASKLERENGLRYDPGTEILATSGSTCGIYAALAALLADGGDVLLPDPVYDAYQSPIRLVGGRVRPVPSAIRNGRFELTVEALEAAWTPSSRMLILNTPWNPTGTVLASDELRAIGDFCVRRDLIVLSDEVYEAITYDGCRHVSPVAAVPQLRERTVLINSLSKSYSMTGWRVGYCAAPAAMIDAMYLVLAQSSRGPAMFVQDAAAEALSGSQDCVQEMRTEYARRRELVLSGLTGIRGVQMLAPEGGFFAMADVRPLGIPSNEIRRRLMLDHGVVVMHGAAYGPAGEGTLRVSFASGGETLERGLAALRDGLTAIASH